MARSACSRVVQSSLGSETPRYVGLPATNLEWDNQCVPKGIDWTAIIASVHLHQGSSQVSENFANFNGRMKMFGPL